LEYEENQEDAIKPFAHFSASTAIAAGLYSVCPDPIPALAAFCAGFLIDGDHLLDLWLYQKHRKPGEKVMEVFDNHMWVTSIVPLHSIELLTVVFYMIFASSQPWLWGGIFLGFGTHLAMDQVGNNTFPMSYSLLFRISRGFKAHHIWTDCQTQPVRTTFS